MTFQPIWGYSLPRCYGIVYIVCLYLHFCVVSSIFGTGQYDIRKYDIGNYNLK